MPDETTATGGCPRIIVFSTGRAIASVSGGNQGAAPTLTAADLVAAVPQLADVAEATAVLFRQITLPDLDLIA